jgi:hypothetical protein
VQSQQGAERTKKSKIIRELGIFGQSVMVINA